MIYNQGYETNYYILNLQILVIRISSFCGISRILLNLQKLLIYISVVSVASALSLIDKITDGKSNVTSELVGSIFSELHLIDIGLFKTVSCHILLIAKNWVTT